MLRTIDHRNRRVDHICCNLQIVLLGTHYSGYSYEFECNNMIYKNLHYEFKSRVVYILNPTRILTVVHLLHDRENHETACIELQYIGNKPDLSEAQ